MLCNCIMIDLFYMWILFWDVIEHMGQMCLNVEDIILGIIFYFLSCSVYFLCILLMGCS